MKKLIVAALLLVLFLTLIPLSSRKAQADGLAFEGITTAYCDSGTMADGAYTYTGAAAGASWLPFGSVVQVPGIGRLTIEDRGVPGLFTIDVFTWSCSRAWDIGREWRTFFVLRWGWGGWWL